MMDRAGSNRDRRDSIRMMSFFGTGISVDRLFKEDAAIVLTKANRFREGTMERIRCADYNYLMIVV